MDLGNAAEEADEAMEAVSGQKKAGLKVAGGLLVGALAIAFPLTAHFEGDRLTAYLDPVGIPTICYGETQGVHLGQTATQDDCNAMLAGSLGQALQAVDAAVKVPMPDTRRAALASFVYNVGAKAFLGSQVLRKINAGDAYGGCNEMLRWVYAGGKVLKGLQSRRQAERDLCLQGLERPDV